MGEFHAKSAGLCSFLTLRKPRISEQRYCGSKSRVKWRGRKCEQCLNLNRSLDRNRATSKWKFTAQHSNMGLMVKSVEDLMNDWGAAVLEGLRGRGRKWWAKGYASEKVQKRGTRQPKGWCVPREIERQTAFYYSCAKLETASFKICPLKLPVRSKGKTSVRW